MRWQAIQERAAETVPLAALRLGAAGAAGIEEVQSLGDIAEGLRAKAGDSIAAFYLEAMKIK
jgi:hypothetical protein